MYFRVLAQVFSIIYITHNAIAVGVPVFPFTCKTGDGNVRTYPTRTASKRGGELVARSYSSIFGARTRNHFKSFVFIPAKPDEIEPVANKVDFD